MNADEVWAEGWADLRPLSRAYGYRSVKREDRRWPRAQHYFLNGRSLCGKRDLSEDGFAKPAAFELPRNPKNPTPACAKCDKRASSYQFRRRRKSRLGARAPEADRYL